MKTAVCNSKTGVISIKPYSKKDILVRLQRLFFPLDPVKQLQVNYLKLITICVLQNLMTPTGLPISPAVPELPSGPESPCD